MSRKTQYFQTSFKAIAKSEAKSEEAQAITAGTVIQGYASTMGLDRYNDVVEPEAFRKSILSNYRKNPIILFQHNPERPIGKATLMSIDGKGLYIEGVIHDDEVEEKIKVGILKAFSIGYIPKSVEYEDGDGNKLDIEKEEDRMKIFFDRDVKRIIKEVDLVENSVVSVPANPDALFTMEKSVKNFFDKQFIEKFLQVTENEIIYKRGEGQKDLIFPKSEQWGVKEVQDWLINNYKHLHLLKNNIMPKKENLLEKKDDEKVEETPVEAVEEKPEETTEDVKEETTETNNNSDDKTEDVETPTDETNGEGGSDETSAEDVEEESKEEEAPAETPEEKPEEEGEKAFNVDQTKIALKTIADLTAENKALKEQLKKTPAKEAEIYNSKFADTPETSKKPEEKIGFKDALVGAAN